MAQDDAVDAAAKLTSSDVARLTGLSQATVLRIPKDVLDYWLTPGGGLRRHRRYKRGDVERYMREVLGRGIATDGTGQ